jgi:hypothetical protein
MVGKGYLLTLLGVGKHPARVQGFLTAFSGSNRQVDLSKPCLVSLMGASIFSEIS